MDCREVEESYGAYLLGALEKRDREKVEAHIARCASCSVELREDAHAVTYLANAVPQVVAPARVKAGLMARIDAAPDKGLLESPAASLRRLGAALVRPSWTMAGAYAGATAAAVIAIVSIVWLNDLAGDTQVLQRQAEIRAQQSDVAMANVEQRLDEVESTQSEMAQKVETVANVGTRLDAVIAEQTALASQVQTVSTSGTEIMGMLKEARYLTYMAAAPDTAVNMIGPEEPAGQTRGMMLIAPSRTWGLLAVLELPPLPEGKVYQAWLIDGNEIVNAGVFVVDETGYGQTIVHFVGSPDRFENIGITVEPKGGSPFPTSETVLLGDF